MDLFHLFLPNNCKTCNCALIKGERFICINCVSQLPRTHYHLIRQNPVEKSLWGRVHFQKASSWLQYSKGGMVQRLLYELKYNGIQELGIWLGEMIAYDLNENNFFEGVDMLLPIPLHEKKQHKRGYNQSELIAKGINTVTNVEINQNAVVRVIASPTQTRKSRMSRWENVSEIMKVVDENSLQGKHVLLIDDVITTGSTIEAMVSVMESIPKIKISILTLCCASDF